MATKVTVYISQVDFTELRKHRDNRRNSRDRYSALVSTQKISPYAIELSIDLDELVKEEGGYRYSAELS